MVEMRESGLSYNEIATRLNAAGVATKRGGTWWPSTVSRSLDPAAREAARLKSEKNRTLKRLQAERKIVDAARERLGLVPESG
jgi:Recombinase